MAHGDPLAELQTVLLVFRKVVAEPLAVEFLGRVVLRERLHEVALVVMLVRGEGHTVDPAGHGLFKDGEPVVPMMVTMNDARELLHERVAAGLFLRVMPVRTLEGRGVFAEELDIDREALRMDRLGEGLQNVLVRAVADLTRPGHEIGAG